MNAQQVISHYESLATLTSKMRIAAAQGEWDRLISLEQQCRHHWSSINSSVEIPLQDETSRQIVVQLIRKIIADDAEIRNQTEDWMGQLQNIMHSNRQEQRLNRTYGAT